MQPLATAALGLGTGIMIGVAAGAMLRTAITPVPKPEPVAVPEVDDSDDSEALLAANANLVSSLQECNRRLTDVGQKRVTAPTPQPTAASSSGRMRGQGRREAPPPDWDRYAKQGVVPYNVPCLRDTPFTPSARQLDRLGLAPQDAAVLRDAYKKSNERVMAQLKPLCAKVLGNAEIADRVGSSACMSAIVDSARKENPDKMRDALTRVAEVNGGKRAAPDPSKGVEPVEALMLAFTGESKAFEADLAAALGPDDAHRIASSRTLCSERGIVRARPDAPQDERAPRE
jgi:hypothetical protein